MKWSSMVSIIIDQLPLDHFSKSNQYISWLINNHFEWGNFGPTSMAIETEPTDLPDSNFW